MSNSSDGKDFNTDITADPSDLLAGFRKATTGAQSMADGIVGHVGSIGKAFSGLLTPLMAIGAVLAGGAFFKETINASNKLTGEQTSLAKALGISGLQASALNTALGDIGTDSETYIDAFQKFAKQLKNNEEGLQAMGLQTRDANGNLRDSNTLYTEALNTVGSYRSGLDQTTAAMTLFGKGVDEVMTLQKLNNKVIEEAKIKNRELGLTITKEGVENSKAYKRAMNDVGDVFLAIKNVIGQAVMPVFTSLSQYFAETGPHLINVFRGALTGLLVVFRGLEVAVKSASAVIFEMINHTIDQLGNLSELMAKIFAGDFKGAGEVWERMKGRFVQGIANVVGASKEALHDAQGALADDMTRIWGKGTELDAPKGGTKTMGDFKTSKESQIPELEAELAQRKVAIERQGLLEGQLREMSKADEFKYWDEINVRRDLSDKDRAIAARKSAEVEMAMIRETFDVRVAALQAEAAQYKNNTDERLRIEREIQSKFAAGTKQYEESQKRIVEIQRQAAEQEKAVAQSRIEARRQAELQVIALEEQTAQTARQLGIIDQAELLARQQSFEDRRYAITREGVEARLAIAEQDPDRNKVEVEKIHREIEQLEQQHQLRLAQIRNQALVESSKYMTSFVNDLSSGLASVFSKVGTQIKSIGDLTRAMWQTLTQVTIQMLAKMAAEWVKQQLLMMIFGKTTTLGKIAEKSAEAGAGGIASMAAAPFPLNLSAPAFGAAMAAAALAFAPVASAAGGFDIPGNINPIVQAHADEMILPSHISDWIRDATHQGAGSGGGDTHHWNVHALDPRSFKQWLRDGGGAEVVGYLKQARRNFNF
jgi:hypothetical protein